MRTKNIICFLLLLFLISAIPFLASALRGNVFVDDTDINFSKGNLTRTNISGSGVQANVTLNFTTSYQTNVSYPVYNNTGNFTSRIFDSRQNHTVFDKIEWRSTLVNTSDVMGFATHSGASDVGVFYRNGSIGTNTNQADFANSFALTTGLRLYTVPAGFNRYDILGFGWDDDNAPNLYAFFRNGSVAIAGGQSALTSDVSFTTTSSYTLPGGFNTSDIIGFAFNSIGNGASVGNAAVFFKNGSYLRSQNTESGPWAFSTVLAYRILPSGFKIEDAIGVDFNRAASDIAIFFRNNSYVSNISQADFTTDIKFDVVRNATYHSNANITESTNITLETRISNDTNLWSAWSSDYILYSGTQSIEAVNGRYMQYRAVFSTTDIFYTPFLDNVSVNYTIDIYGPQINASINNTNPEFGEVINISANLSDPSGLNKCQFIDNMTGIIRFFNYSAPGTNGNCSQNYTISKGLGNVVNFSLVVNDTYGNKNQAELVITIAGIPPKWQNAVANNSIIEQFDFVMFNTTWTDNIGLSSYFFSTNSTGKWVNYSNISFSGAINISNFTYQINSSPNFVVGWIFYANDTSSNFNSTDFQTFIVASQYNIFYGNIKSDIILDTSQNLSVIAWLNNSKIKGNLYVTDSDALNGISWTSLQAIGKDKAKNDVANDWEDIDTLLGMSNFNDSINLTYTSNQKPKNKTDFVVRGILIENVSTVNSTNSSNFVTGILWDTSDSADAQYDTSEKEDLVFVSKATGKNQGLFGIYNYEIKIPARLQRYRTPNNQDSLSFYVELTS